MFSGGFTEIGFILFIAFLLFGPKKLPEIARTLGKGLAELRRATNDLKFSLEEEIRNLDSDDRIKYTAQETHPYDVEAGEAARDDQQTKDRELSHQAEGDLEPASEYGYNYSTSSQQEPEPRPRG